jgi:hypothetical protein
MKVKIEIEADNDEMHTWEEIAYAIARRFQYLEGEVETQQPWQISDRSGNVVGYLTTEED